MLQNRYGDVEFPIRNRWAHARLYRQALLRIRPSWAAIRNLVWMSPALVLLTILFIGTDGFNRVPSGDAVGVVVLLEIGGTAILIAAGITASTLADRRKPRLEQQHYWKAVGAPVLTTRQQQLLAMDAQSDYSFGGWNSSLDYGPAWSRMPADARARHEREPKWHPFITVLPAETDQLRAQLDTDWHIASEADLQLFVADVLAERSLSARFGAILAGADGERMLARVSSLTGIDQWDLRALTHPSDGRPAKALWAADSQRLISVIRMGYLAGYIGAPAAWELIERAAAPAAALFDSWDDYWRDVRIGLAFLSDQLQAVQRFDHTLAALRASDWPAARAEFPRSPVPAWLPRSTPPSADALTD